MSAEPPIEDDPVIRRVAAVRPGVPEDDLSPDGPRAQAILERVLTGSPPTVSGPSRRRWVHPRWALTRVGLALAPVTAVVVLLLAGTFSGPDRSGTQPAAAAVISAAVRALDPTGTILVQDETSVSGPSVHGHPYTVHQVLETPNGPGPQNLLTTYSDPRAVGSRFGVSSWAYVGGEQAFYSRITNTIYERSIWGPYLHPGPRPGTFVYRNAAGGPAYTQRPIVITAGQRRALLSGTDAIMLTSTTVGDKVKIGPFKVRPVSHAAGYAQGIREDFTHHTLHFVGRTTVDGRPALEVAGTTNGARSGEGRYYLDPTTHLPFEEIDQPGSPHQQVIHLRLRKLPITRTNERLLSLHALHPTARIDRSDRDYLRAAHGSQFYAP